MKFSSILLLLLGSVSLFGWSGIVYDSKTDQPVFNATVSDSHHFVISDKNGHFQIKTQESHLHIKALGYKPKKVMLLHKKKKNLHLFLSPIKVKALYLTFWGASNNSKTLKNILDIIDTTEINAVVVDVKNEYGSTQFLTGFQQANSYGAHKQRTNRNIQKFIATMKQHGVYTIARIVTFKDELQASHNYDYAIKKDDENQTIWRNHDKMAWVNPFDTRAHDYTISIAKEAAKVGYDEINFDYIRFPAKEGLLFLQQNTQENRIKAIESFLDTAQKRLRKYGVFISVDVYGNVCWSNDDNGIGQTLQSLAQHADYISPMLYPSGFATGSFHLQHPAQHPYKVVFRSLARAKKKVGAIKLRPWLQYFRDYTQIKHPYTKKEIQAQIQAANDANVSGWMFWSPSSKYNPSFFKQLSIEK
jgi:hypothetical protein